ncbi:DNA/RNA helicase [Acetobacter orientalis]|uniref:DNA/RNA helicase n=1 Tax=Acetobacter orientalis TaxID=146474 RepID=A0A2Z5ZK63_9PROT|nr:DNA/RNA helicase [Acetobacter orientalis]
MAWLYTLAGLRRVCLKMDKFVSSYGRVYAATARNFGKKPHGKF